MKKMVFSVMVILLLLVGLVPATGAAGYESKEVIVSAWQSRSYTISEGDTVSLQAAWGACSPGFVKTFIAASNWEVTLDGEPLLTPDDVDGLWSAMVIFESPPWFAEYCLGVGRPAAAQWRYILSGLEPGTHVLHTSMRLNHTLTDGCDSDGDGRPDLFTPEGYTRDSDNTITVEPVG